MTYPATQDELTDGVPSDGLAPTTELDDATYPHDDHHRALAQTLEGVQSVLGYGGTMPGEILFADLLGDGVGVVGFPRSGLRFGVDAQTGDVGLYGIVGSDGSGVEIFGVDDSATFRGIGGVFIDGPGTNEVAMNAVRNRFAGPTLEFQSFNDEADWTGTKLKNLIDPTAAQDAATKNSQDAAVAAEAALARNADNLTSGTVADARIASTIARDSEVTTAVSDHSSDTTSVHGITDTSTLYRSGGTDVAVADGGTGSSTAADALTALGAQPVRPRTNTVAAAGATETLDGDDFDIHDVTLDENITFTFTTGSAVTQFTLILRQDGSGTNTVTWPASVKWHAATAPTILTSASAVHVLEFLTVDTGTTWRGFFASSNVS